MRTITVLLLVTASVALIGCSEDKKAVSHDASTSRKEASQEQAASPAAPAKLDPRAGLSYALVTTIGGRQHQQPEVSLEGAAAVQAATFAADRKIIRNCDLAIETDSPSDGLRKITSIAEQHGGFVVTS